MYAHFYQLSENPFNLTPDPKFHYVNASTREAMASILHGIKSRKGFITLIAEAGTGKTTLLKRIVDEIEGETQVVFVFNPGVSFDELLEFICSELGIETHNAKRLHLLDRLNSHLLEQLTKGLNVVVMIDEAQTLEDSVLEELRLLSNLETAKEKILQILLSGQPELEEKLRKPALRQLRQRIGVRATLKPVRIDEMQAYVETRLRSAGAERNDLFTPAALKRIWQASKGIPRVINVICDNAMMLAFADGRKRITPKLLREAVRDLEGEIAPGSFGGGAPEWLSSRVTGYVLAAAAVVAAAIPLAGVVQRNLMTGVEQVQVASVPVNDAVDAEPAAALPAADAADAKDSDDLDIRRRNATDSFVNGASAEEEAASRHALNSDPTGRPAIVDSMRRAEVIARSTAARLYGKDQDGQGASRRRDIADDALDQVAREGGLRAPNTSSPTPAAADDDDMPPPTANIDDPAPPPPAVPEAVIAAKEAEAAKAAQAAKEAEAAKEAAAKEEAAKQAALAKAAKEAAAKEAAAKEAAAAKLAAKEAAAKEAAAKEAAAKAKAAEEAKLAAEKEKATASAQATTSSEEVKAAVAAAMPEGSAVASAPAPGPIPQGPFALGRAVRVADGDTVWDIAIKQYGSAGPAVLKRILVSNPGVRDPLRLPVGSTVFLPYSRPDQMVRKDGSSYRIVLASGTSRERIEELARWATAIAGELRLMSSTTSTGPVLYELSVVGIPSEAQALRLATNLFENAGSGSSERTAMR